LDLPLVSPLSFTFSSAFLLSSIVFTFSLYTKTHKMKNGNIKNTSDIDASLDKNDTLEECYKNDMVGMKYK
jgi:hypothetical protein